MNNSIRKETINFLKFNLNHFIFERKPHKLDKALLSYRSFINRMYLSPLRRYLSLLNRLDLVDDIESTDPIDYLIIDVYGQIEKEAMER